MLIRENPLVHTGGIQGRFSIINDHINTPNDEIGDIGYP